MRRALLLALLPLAACAKGAAPPPEELPVAEAAGGDTSPPPAGMTDAVAKRVAMELWRDDELRRHPKGSCAGRHGPDFLDLAAIGSTDTDLRPPSPRT